MGEPTVPFADLYGQYQSIKAEIDEAVAAVIRESAFIRGPFVDKFETEFAAASGAAHCVSCANGTDALHIAMFALGIKPGDEVITSAHSWIATSAMITRAGGSVVFCDTDEDTYTIDPKAIEAKITPRTVGIIPVHLYGQAADMDPILAIARRHRLWVVEDCAQAHLARYKEKPVGTFGNAATFSFYPGKNLGALGDAGAIVTQDEALARRMAMFARHGGLVKGDHQIEGVNSRLDGLQAAILSVKLKHLVRWTRRRREIAAEYDSSFAAIPGVTAPAPAAGRDHVFHLYVIRHEKRDELADYLKTNGIQTVINYPVALPFLPAYAYLGSHKDDYPNAYRNQSRVLSLPIFAEISARQIGLVIDAISQFGSKNGQ
jgi:dTDP-4-amino-4,6-dideoxygalactose transaminase